MEHLSVVTEPEAPTTALGAGPGFVVELEAFSGPLDLLLHLLREEKFRLDMARKARAAAEANYRWDVQMTSLDQVIAGLSAQRAASLFLERA